MLHVAIAGVGTGGELLLSLEHPLKTINPTSTTQAVSFLMAANPQLLSSGH
jgi:hypothetical protein